VRGGDRHLERHREREHYRDHNRDCFARVGPLHLRTPGCPVYR
jgi:hypothetical protein